MLSKDKTKRKKWQTITSTEKRKDNYHQFAKCDMFNADDDDYKKIEQLKTTIANYESNTDSNNISKETSDENQPTGEDSPENQNADETTEDEEKLDVPESDPASENSGNNQKPPIAPWDVRLYRSDLFVKGFHCLPMKLLLFLRI